MDMLRMRRSCRIPLRQSDLWSISSFNETTTVNHYRLQQPQEFSILSRNEILGTKWAVVNAGTPPCLFYRAVQSNGMKMSRNKKEKRRTWQEVWSRTTQEVFFLFYKQQQHKITFVTSQLLFFAFYVLIVRWDGNGEPESTHLCYHCGENKSSSSSLTRKIVKRSLPYKKKIHSRWVVSRYLFPSTGQDPNQADQVFLYTTSYLYPTLF